MKAKKSKPLGSTNSLHSAHQKNSTPTTPAGSAPRTFRARHGKTLLFYVGYVVLTLVAAFCFYRRFPNSFHQPNFYGEDGSVFTDNLLDKGFWQALFTTFNGYFIWGIYLLGQAGLWVNNFIGGGQFVNIPRSLAVMSYLFLGFSCTLPVLLFRNYLRPAVLALIVVLSVFVPMTGWDYAVIGTIGNAKFAFTYIAFLLLVYRQLLPKDSKTFFAVDLGLLVCAYTNVTVYPMLLFALLRYVPAVRPRPKLRPNLANWLKSLLGDKSFISLIILGLLLLYQLYIIKVNGVPALTGYLDSPYQFNRTIEIFIARSYLYGVLYPINAYLNDVLVVAILAAFAAGGLYLARGWRKVIVFGLVSIFMATFLFVSKRTGVSAFYTGYHDSGPDQFFYAQNWIFIFIVCIVAGSLLKRLKASYRLLGYTAVTLLLVAIYIPHAGSYGRNNFMEQKIHNIYLNAQASCSQTRKQLSVAIYPAAPLRYPDIPRSELCTASTLNYRPKDVSLGLEPFENHYVDSLGSKNRISQTFVSPRSHLDGLNIYFSTFGSTVDTPYTLRILDQSCTTSLRVVGLPVTKLHDNAFYLVRFEALSSRPQAPYCFTISADKTTKPDPLALQLSKPDIYVSGEARLNGSLLAEDVVFGLHYKD